MADMRWRRWKTILRVGKKRTGLARVLQVNQGQCELYQEEIMSLTVARNLFCLAAATFALSITAASAETVRVLCTFPPPYPANQLITVDFAAQTLGADRVDEAGNVTIMAFHRMPATITDETVSADWGDGNLFFRFALNRYSLVLLWGQNGGTGYTERYSSPCTPYQRGQRKL
jgi:hypothetical protein